MIRKKSRRSLRLLSYAITAWLSMPAAAWAAESQPGETSVSTADIHVEADAAKEEAKYESQQKTIITKEDIEKKQAKSVEEIIFSETGVSRTVDAMGRVGVSIRGAEPRHTLILVDGQPVMGDFAKYYGAADEVMRLGTENVERIEIIQGAASAKYGSDAIGGVVNIITKKAGNQPAVQFNAEGRTAKKDELFPYRNVFLRADSGAVGKIQLGVYGSKRDIMPVYADEARVKTGMSTYVTDFEDNSLRYYGDATNVGLIGSYAANKNNTFNFRLERYTEDLNRYVKRTDSIMEPQQHYSRKSGRNTYNVGWKGRNKDTDWNIEINHTRLLEDDLTLTSNYGRSSYTGKNMLNYIDNVDHAQTNIDATFNTQLNDKHLLTYNIGYAREHGSGSRLKSAPKTYLRKIDPWDYDKSLLVVQRDAKDYGLKKGDVASFIHAHKLIPDAERGLRWDVDNELYGYNSSDPNSYRPEFTYEDYLKYSENGSKNFYATLDAIDADGARARYNAFNAKVGTENSDHLVGWNRDFDGLSYYSDPNKIMNYTLNGKLFQEIQKSLKNQVIVGEATINKYHFVIGDTWMMDNDTIFSPILRLDHSSLFGTHVTANLGLTRNIIKGNPHLRFKTNLGTSYAEPGMGELYYNWEMYGGSPVDQDRARLGWYWTGNPNLKPEKSLNFDIGIEGETKRTTMRMNLFRNTIRNYMTTYYTGYNIDFHPNLKTAEKLGYPPDMLYSFKNIGKAQITGLELEVKQKFDKHWSGKFGYTYLHAVNKSDPNMPRQLLDKPKHKLDIGLDYENVASGFRASLWGDYYIHMLDSNSVTGNANYMTMDSDLSGGYIFANQYARPGAQRYQTKTFGIWNLMLQQKFGEDAMAYFGIDNIFNHRDDDRASQARVYRLGVNFKFGPDSSTRPKPPLTEEEKAARAAQNAAAEKDFFAQTNNVFAKGSPDEIFARPFNTQKLKGVDLIGDYQFEWDSHGGSNRPPIKMTEDSSVGSAEKNMLDRKEHGFAQRLRFGFDARVRENLNIAALAEASGKSGVDTRTDIPQSKALNHLRLSNFDITYHNKNVDISLGRLQERMGVTGYWFGKTYDGIRAAWTNAHTQIRLGYGTFKQSTGITDSAYTHATRQVFYRPPTIAEFIGLNRSLFGSTFDTPAPVADANENMNFYQQLTAAKERGASVEEQMAIIKRMYDIATAAYGSNLLRKNDQDDAERMQMNAPGAVTYQYRDASNTLQTGTIGSFDTLIWGSDHPEDKENFYMTMADYPGVLEGNGSAGLQAWWAANKAKVMTMYENIAKSKAGAGATNITLTTSESDVYNALFHDNFISETTDDALPGTYYYPKSITSYFNALGKRLYWTEYASLLPRDALGKYTGAPIRVEGTVLESDRIPPIEKAFFLQAKHAVTPNLGVSLWYLGSAGNAAYRAAHANGRTNDVYDYSHLASVIGVGAKWKMGPNVAVSFDYGQNRTPFARHMNGHTLYDHVSGTDRFDLKGHVMGGTPHFWTLRFDIGRSDIAVKGSWNVFADYKHFEHGSFFGGNGTGYLPDRYLDGIRSFSVGAGYVPVENLLVEMFYTFDAKGIGTRDTIYGSEKFSLGNYAGVRLTYSF